MRSRAHISRICILYTADLNPLDEARFVTEIGAHIRGFMWIAARRTAIGARGGLIYGNDYTSVRDKFAVDTMTDRLSTFIDFYTRYVSHRGA